MVVWSWLIRSNSTFSLDVLLDRVCLLLVLDYNSFCCFFFKFLLGFTGFNRVLLSFTCILLGLTEFDWVWLGFTGFYRVPLGFDWVLLGLIEFYWVLPSSIGVGLGFTGFYEINLDLPSFAGLLGFTRFYWLLLGFTGFYLVLLSFTEFYWVLLGFIGFYLVLPSFTGLCCDLLGFTGFLLGYTRFYWVLLGFTGFYWVLLGFTGFERVLMGFTGFWLVEARSARGRRVVCGHGFVFTEFSFVFFCVLTNCLLVSTVLPGHPLSLLAWHNKKR